LDANIQQGVSSLTQLSLLACTIDYSDQLVENEQLSQQVQQANKKIDATTKRANLACERVAQLEDTIKLIRQKLVMMMK